MAKKEAPKISGRDKPSQRTPAAFRLINIGVVVGLSVLITIIFRTLGPILKPFLIAIFLAYLLYPTVSFLSKKKIPKSLAYILVFIFIFGLFYVLGALITINVNAFLDNLPEYELRFQQLLEQVSGLVRDFGILQRLGLEEKLDFREFSLFEYISIDRLTSYIGSSLGSFIEIVGNILVVVFFMIFILMEADRFNARVNWAYGSKKGGKILNVIDDINHSVRKYLWAKTLISLGTGLLFALILGVFGVEFFILWGLLAFLLNFIPYIGSYVATILPVAMAFIQIQFSPIEVLIILGLLLVIQNVVGNIIEPRVLGRELNLSPLVVLIALAFWGWLWGLTGMFLAIPVTASVKIVMEHIPETRNIARLMSDVTEPPKNQHKKKRGFPLTLFRKNNLEE